MYKTQVELTFQQADLAGIMFFANIFVLSHQAYEKMIQEHLKMTWDEWFKSKDFAVPIRHCESEYFKPLLPGQKYDVEISAKHVGQSSYTLSYRFLQNNFLHAEAQVTNVFIAMKTLKKIDIPIAIKDQLSKLLPHV